MLFFTSFDRLQLAITAGFEDEATFFVAKLQKMHANASTPKTVSRDGVPVPFTIGL
jgi:hypothetical protein